MRIKVLVLTIILSLKVFSAYNVDDYILFHKGLQENKKENYRRSELIYEVYLENYKDSYPLISNYAKYYIAKNYYDLKNYKEAIIFFNRAVYTPEKYIKQETFKTNFFQYRRDFYMGKIYYELKDFKKSEEYYSRLIKNYYDPDLTKYEKLAFEQLIKFNDNYKYLYIVKYQEKFEYLNELKYEDVAGLSEYFYEKKEYLQSKECIEYLINTYNDIDFNLKKRYINTLLNLKENKKIIQLTNKENDYFMVFYRGIAFSRERDYSRAIYNYKKLLNTEYDEDVKFKMAKIYYDLQEYEKARILIKKCDKKNEKISSILLNIYIKVKNKKQFVKEYENFNIKYPSNYKNGVYYLIYNQIMKKDKNPWEVENYNAFFIGNFIVRDYIVSLKNGLEKRSFEEKTLKDALVKIGKLEDKELFDVAIKSGTFTLKNKNSDNSIILESLVESGFYYDAYKYAIEHSDKLYKNKRLLSYLYPKYYKREVEDVRKEYLVPDSLVYTIINVESSFNNRFKNDDKIGLMGVKKDGKLSEEYYFNPKNNILIGMKKLEKYYFKYKGNNLKILLAYIYGEKEIEKINFELDGDINLDTIKNNLKRKEIEKIIYTYAFYSGIYN